MMLPLAVRSRLYFIQKPWGRLTRLLPSAAYHVQTTEWGHIANKRIKQCTPTSESTVKEILQVKAQHPYLYSLLTAYRSQSFKREIWNPIPASVLYPGQGLDQNFPEPPELSLARQNWDAAKVHINSGNETSKLSPAVGMAIEDKKSIDEILSKIYESSIGVEFEHVEDASERQWLYTEFERMQIESHNVSENELYRQVLLMQKSALWDKFLANKFSTVKRYSGEGAESSLVCIDSMLKECATQHGISHVVIGMPHRGRNTFLTVLLDYPVQEFFAKMKGRSEFPSDLRCTGDTFSHFFTTAELKYDSSTVRVSLLPNPSHLEAVVPLAVGKCRSKMQTLGEGDYSKDSSLQSFNGDATLNIQVHGDAAMVGQGVVYETLAMSQVPHFRVGGSLHVVINNQVGFTTDSVYGRSYRNCTDMAHTICAPVLHVNAEDVSAVARASRFALHYRQLYRRDIFINLVCYRRYGHNELDEPSLTQPVLYDYLRENILPAPLPDRILSSLSPDQRKNIDEELKQWSGHLTQSFAEVDSFKPTLHTFKDQWKDMQPPRAPSDLGLGVYNTGVQLDVLQQLGLASVQLPDNFNVHPTLKRSVVEKRIEKFQSHEKSRDLDWATAEALAVSSLLWEGHPVRISGQDVGRGTFSHRHWMLVDQQTDELYIPLNHLDKAVPAKETSSFGKLEVANSILSEFGVLGFEVGMAVDNPQRLALWEAQFGDFFNTAQVIVDTYLSSAEMKWLYQCGLVLLLPHGYEGAGPEHSSCRVERFLQMTDSMEAPIRGHANPMECMDDDCVNMHVVIPTTPAQYFHLLRRQMKRPFRRPLIVVTPKNLLRLPAATSHLEDMGPGTHFHHILSTHNINEKHPHIERVILCSGRHYYTLKQHLDDKHNEWRKTIAVIRLEQLAPFPTVELSKILTLFPNASRFTWSQEEHRNMGAWNFVEARVRNWLNVSLTYAGRRKALGPPAVLINELHRQEILEVLADTFDN